MRLIRPSQTFAESVLFMDAPGYPVHGEAVEAGELVALDRETFLGILRESFEAISQVHELGLGQRLPETRSGSPAAEGEHMESPLNEPRMRNRLTPACVISICASTLVDGLGLRPKA